MRKAHHLPDPRLTGEMFFPYKQTLKIRFYTFACTQVNQSKQRKENIMVGCVVSVKSKVKSIAAAVKLLIVSLLLGSPRCQPADLCFLFL